MKDVHIIQLLIVMLGFHICIYDNSKKINHLLYTVCDSQEL